MAHPSHLPDAVANVKLFLSSTWGRADQHTSHDSNRVWGVLFCAKLFGARPCVLVIARPSHLPDSRSKLGLFLSSTWGRADQQTPHDSNRVGGVLFCARQNLKTTKGTKDREGKAGPMKFIVNLRILRG